jgi:hypothetical protein
VNDGEVLLFLFAQHLQIFIIKGAQFNMTG